METQENRVSWRRYLGYCKRLCPKELSFEILLFTIPFYKAWESGVPHRFLMCEIEHVSKNAFAANYTPEQRIAWINSRIEEFKS